MKLGKYKLTFLESGELLLDGGAMFGVIPKTMWSKNHPADDLNRIKLTMRNLLVEYDNRKVLIDTGVGSKTTAKFNKIFSIDSNYTIETELEKINIKIDEITDVILTHLHFDHCGGSTKIIDNQVVPTFTNAKYYVQKEHYDWALKPTERDRASFFNENYVPLLENGNMVFTEGDHKLFDDFEVFRIFGHTPAQQLVKIKSDDGILVYAADFLPFASQISLPAIMSYDLFPLTTLEEKKKIFPRAYEEKWIFVFEHDPVYSTAQLGIGEKGYFPEKTNII